VNPLSVSVIRRQSLSVQVLKPQLFVTQELKFLLEGQPNYVLTKKVPQQLASAEDQKKMKKAEQATQATGGVGVLLTLTISIVANRALKHIWVFFAAL
jgi:hypothetical protein